MNIKKLNKLTHINVGDGPTTGRTKMKWTMPGKEHEGDLPHTTVGLEKIVSKLLQKGISHPQLTVETVLRFLTDSSISFNIWTVKHNSYGRRKLATSTDKKISPSKEERPDEKREFTVLHCVLTFLVFVQEFWVGVIKIWTYAKTTILIPSQCLVIAFSSVNLRRQATCYNVIFRRVHVTIFAVIQQQVLALDIRHAKCMRRITLSCVACLALSYFATLSHKHRHFRMKKKSYWI